MAKKIDSNFDNRTGSELADARLKKNIDKNAKFHKVLVVALLILLLIGSTLATQYIAYRFSYHSALGGKVPFTEHAYLPWMYFIWSVQYHDLYPDVFNQGFMRIIYSLVPLLFILLYKINKDSKKLVGDKYAHGAGRWANLQDIQEAALLPKKKKELVPDLLEWEHATFGMNKEQRAAYEKKHPRPEHERPGVIVGAWIDPVSKKYWYLRDYSKTHDLMIAKTRSGKGISIINPTAASWPESMFVYDIKGELWALFSGRRAEMNQFAMKFSPREKRREVNGIYENGIKVGWKFEKGIWDKISDEFTGVKENKTFIEAIYTEIDGVKTLINALDQDGNEIVSIDKGLNDVHGLYDLEDHNKKVMFGERYEKEEYNVVRWNPFDTIRYENSRQYKFVFNDPANKKKGGHLESYISKGNEEIADCNNVVDLIIKPDGETKGDPHWTESAKNLIVAVVLFTLHNLPELACPKLISWTLSNMIDYAKIAELRKTGKFKAEWDLLPRNKGESVAITSLYTEMQKGLDYQGKTYKTADNVVRVANEMLGKAKDEGASILSTAQRFFSLYSDPLVAENTEKSDFSISQLMNMDKPCSLFMVVQPEDKDDLRPLVRLMINRILKMLASGMEFEGGSSVNSFNHRLLCMIDEMPTLGKLDILQEALGYCAGYGLKFLMVVQDITQLKDKYGDKESIRANCQIQMYFATSNEETAKEMSAAFDTTTRIKENISISENGGKISKSKSIQEISRPLLTVGECMNLPAAETDADGKVLKPGAIAIKATGFPGIMGEQSLYFQNPELLRRAQLPTRRFSDRLLVEKDGMMVDTNSVNEEAGNKKNDKKYKIIYLKQQIKEYEEILSKDIKLRDKYLSEHPVWLAEKNPKQQLWLLENEDNKKETEYPEFVTEENPERKWYKEQHPDWVPNTAKDKSESKTDSRKIGSISRRNNAVQTQKSFFESMRNNAKKENKDDSSKN